MVKSRIFAILEVVFIAMFIFSLYKLIMIYANYNEGDKIYEESQQTYIKEEKKEDTTFTVDITKLKEDNKDGLGWIYIRDTAVNYPVLQTNNNDYYLKHTYNRKYSDFGSIFLDYRCSPDMTDKNTIIYGHNTKNGSMFGGLKKYKDKSYLDEHPYIDLVFDGVTYQYKIISAFTVEITDDIYTLDFPSESSFKTWLNRAKYKSQVETDDFSANGDENVITLSTCTSRTKTERFVIIAVQTSKIANNGTAILKK